MVSRFNEHRPRQPQGMLGRALAVLLLCTLVWTPLQAAQTASLNMRDVDIRTLVDAVAEITGRNFLLDPRVKGNVTVISARPMEPDELYEVFLSILQVHGYAAIPSGKVVKIVPDSSAKQDAPVGEPGPGPDGLLTKVIAVHNVAAADLISVLRPLMPQQSHLEAHADSNSLIVLGRAANVARLEHIIRRIDRADSSEIEVVRLEHASANEVVRIVSSLLGAAPGQAKQKAGAATIAADERTNSVLLGGDHAARLKMRGLIAHLDTPLESGSNTQVVFLRYAKAKELASLLQASFSGAKGGKGLRRGADDTITIQADEHNNALIVSAPPDVARELLIVVRQLDIRRAQVLVEAVIAEVSTDLSHELGTQFVLGQKDGEVDGPVGVTNFGPSGRSIVSIGQGIISNAYNLGSGAYLGLGNIGGDGRAWAVLVNALAGDAATNILSTPTLLATDNQEAEIVVGQNVPFITGQYVNTGSTSTVTNPFQTIERRDIGITLRVTPQVNEGNSIQLALEQEVSSLAPTSTSASDLITNKRSIRTNVTVEDGQIIVLGGLIEDTYQDSQQKVPLLGDVPVLGNLFRYDSSQKVKKNLMVFLRPVLLRDPALASSYSGQKYSYLRSRQLEARLKDRPQSGENGGRLPPRVEDLFDRGARLPPPQPAAAKPTPAPVEDVEF